MLSEVEMKIPATNMQKPVINILMHNKLMLTAHSDSVNEIRSLEAFQQLQWKANQLRNGVKIDWSNRQQKKYLPKFRYIDGFFGWRCTGAVEVQINQAHSIRLCVDTPEKAFELGTWNYDIWNHYLNPDG